MLSHTSMNSLPAAFMRDLKRIQSKIPEMTCRIVPSSFDPLDPDLCAIPQKEDGAWRSCTRLFASVKARGVLSRLPPYWQAMSPLHAACREAHVSLFWNDIANMPLGALALAQGIAEVVFAESADASRFDLHCKEAGAPAPAAWVVIHRADAETWEPLRAQRIGCLVVHEAHLFPGVPILEQCETLAAANALRFHLSASYRWDLENGTRITNVEEEPFSLQGFALPFGLEKAGECRCGRPVFVRI